jgi:hypothetical protein
VRDVLGGDRLLGEPGSKAVREAAPPCVCSNACRALDVTMHVWRRCHTVIFQKRSHTIAEALDWFDWGVPVR